MKKMSSQKSWQCKARIRINCLAFHSSLSLSWMFLLSTRLNKNKSHHNMHFIRPVSFRAPRHTKCFAFSVIFYFQSRKGLTLFKLHDVSSSSFRKRSINLHCIDVQKKWFNFGSWIIQVLLKIVPKFKLIKNIGQNDENNKFFFLKFTHFNVLFNVIWRSRSCCAAFISLKLVLARPPVWKNRKIKSPFNYAFVFSWFFVRFSSISVFHI